MSQKEKKATTSRNKSRVEKSLQSQLPLLSHSFTKCCLSSSSCFVSTCPSSSNNQRPELLSAFPVGESRCTVALFAILPVLFFPFLPFFLSAGPSRNKLGKQQAQEKTRSQTFERKPDAAAAAVESSPEIASSLSL